MPRVALDARHLETGIGRHIENLAMGLAACVPDDLELVLVGAPPALERLRLATGFQVRGAVSSLYAPAAQLELPRLLADVDLFHATHYPFPLAYRGRLTVTIHDLHHLRPPRSLRESARWLYARGMLAAAARRAGAMVAISNTVAEELAGRWPAARSRIHVAHPGLDPRFRRVDDPPRLAAYRQEQALPERFILVVGELRPYKNVEALLGALARLPAPIALVIAGRGAGGDSPAVRRARELRLEDRVRFLGEVDDDALPVLMTLATVGACPSRMEGFGYVPLEMMACGLPVVASSIPAHREVLGRAVVWVDPDDVAGWADAVARLLATPADREAASRCGREHATGFRREEEAGRYLEIYRQLLASRRPTPGSS